MLGEALALASAAASGISVVLVRKHSADAGVLSMSIILTAVGMLVLFPLVIAESGFNALTAWGFVLFAASGLLSPGLVRLFYYTGLKDLGASVNSSVFAIYPLYSTVLAVLLLSETVTAWNALGIAAVIVGVIFVGLSMNGNTTHGRFRWKGFVVPVIGGVTLGFATLLRKSALDASSAPILGVAIAYLFSLLPYIMILAISEPHRKALSPRRDLRWFWVAGIGQAVSWLLAFFALNVDKVSITTPLLEVEPLFVVAFAYFYLRGTEHVSAKLVASIAITVAGIVLISI